MYIVPYIMHCHHCNSMSVQHGFFTFNCHRCDILRGKDLDLEGVCPRCKLSDLFMLVCTSIDCLNCDSSEYHQTSEHMNYQKSRLDHHIWSKRYPIDFESLCREAFKPSRVMHQLSLDPEYYD